MEAATRLKACVREIDTVARFGGGEFVVLLEELAPSLEVSMAQAGVITKKIRLAWLRSMPCAWSTRVQTLSRWSIFY
jgi:GGDEF domain-containing protein